MVPLEHGLVELGEALDPHVSVLESPRVILFEQDGADKADGRPDSVLPRWEAAVFFHSCVWRRQSLVSNPHAGQRRVAKPPFATPFSGCCPNPGGRGPGASSV